MRAIHQITPYETPLASGVYTVYQDTTPTGSLESWNIHTLPDGSRLIRADVDHRPVNGTSLLVHALFAPPESGTLLDRVDFQWQTPQLRVHAIYTVFDRELHVGRTIGHGEREQDMHTFVNGFQLDPIALATRLFVSFLADLGTSQTVITPWLTENESQLMLPSTAQTTVIWEGSDLIMAAGQAHTARRCRLTDDQEGTALLWVDAHGIPLQLDEPVLAQRTVLTQFLYRSKK